MKTFACVLLLVTVVVAEPPRYRNFRLARQETEGDQEATTQRADDAPYPAAGFRPAKAFNLPSREQTAPPSASYGVPENSYGPPAFEYGPPEAPSTEYGIPDQTQPDQDNESVTVESVQNEKLEEAPKQDAEVVSNQGAYYVLLPGSQLQRVQFQTENDLRNMAYTARLQYKNEDRAPLYVYTAVPQYQSSAAYIQPSAAYIQASAYVKPSAAYGQVF